MPKTAVGKLCWNTGVAHVLYTRLSLKAHFKGRFQGLFKPSEKLGNDVNKVMQSNLA